MIGRRGHEAVARRLIDTLAQERKALREAAFDRLPSLSRRVESLADELAALGPAEGRVFQGLLAKVRQEAERNMVISRASQRGIRKVQDGVAEAARARRSLQTYSPTGTTTEIHATHGLKDRRT